MNQTNIDNPVEMAFALYFESELYGKNKYNSSNFKFFHLVMHFANCYIVKIHKYRFIHSPEQTNLGTGPFFPWIHYYLKKSDRGYPEKFLDQVFVPTFQAIISVCKMYGYTELIKNCECEAFKKSSYDKWTLRNEFNCSKFEINLLQQFKEKENENIQKESN